MSMCPKLYGCLFMGDSLCQSYCRLYDVSSNGPYQLCCKNLTFSKLRCIFENEYSNFIKYESLFILLGYTDVVKKDEKDFFTEIFSTIKTLKKHECFDIFLCALPVVKGKYKNKVLAFNAALKQVASKYSDVDYIDVSQVLNLPNGEIDLSYYDIVHLVNGVKLQPNTRGFEILHNHIVTNIDNNI